MSDLKKKYISDWGQAIIPSLLYLDLYKLTMLQFFMNWFPNVWAKYNLKVRSAFDFTPYIDEINFQLDELCKLRFTEDELGWMRKRLFFLKKTTIDKLRGFSMDRNYVHAYIDDDGKFQCYSEGPLIQASLFEIYVLAILQEIRSRAVVENENLTEGQKILSDNIEKIKTFSKIHPFRVADFSCRRAVSVKWLDYVISQMKEISSRNFVGTSCVYFAMKYDLTPIGTMAHEAQMLGQSQTHPYDSIEYILEKWAQEYKGELGIALSDTFGSKYFFKKAFHKGLAMQYAGLRHDSGDPIAFGEDAIEFYEEKGINPNNKTLVFSDGLTVERAFEICRHFNGRIQTSFGIGTKIGNALGIEALQIVMKLVEADGKPVIKVSDTPGKGMCQDEVYAEFIANHISSVVGDV